MANNSRQQLTISKDVLKEFIPKMVEAIKHAENDPGRHGVLSVKTKNPEAVVKESVENNILRWTSGKNPAPWIKERPAKFVDFMQRRWAPIGAENDPKNKNQNWAPNVRYFLRKLYGDEMYRKWLMLNLVRSGQGDFNALS